MHLHKITVAGIAFGWLALAASASATTLTFEDLASGTVLSNQYAALGVVFSPNAFTGQGITTNWATNTGMHVTSTDLAAPLWSGGLLSGTVLNGYANDWYRNNGDPSVKMTFSTPVSFVSVTFGQANPVTDINLWAYNGSTLLGRVTASSTTPGIVCRPFSGGPRCDFALTFSAASITSVVFNPGTYQAWVPVDNIEFTQAVPEPASVALFGCGAAALLGWRRRHAARARA